MMDYEDLTIWQILTIDDNIRGALSSMQKDGINFIIMKRHYEKNMISSLGYFSIVSKPNTITIS